MRGICRFGVVGGVVVGVSLSNMAGGAVGGGGSGGYGQEVRCVVTDI